jgi:hypothetical protein
MTISIKGNSIIRTGCRVSICAEVWSTTITTPVVAFFEAFSVSTDEITRIKTILITLVTNEELVVIGSRGNTMRCPETVCVPWYIIVSERSYNMAS